MHMKRIRPVVARALVFLAIFSVLVTTAGLAQNVVIVMIDGARYDESFGAGATNMPRIWNDLRPKGTVYTNFRNDGITKTCAGHSAVLTGVWQDMPNDGSVRPATPTVFEFYRKYTGQPESTCFVISGKTKLEMLTHSVDTAFGSAYGARFVAGATTSDTATWRQIVKVMDTEHPRLLIINFPDVDVNGHAKNWDAYLSAIRGADSLVYRLWNKIESDSVYRERTTMFVTNDHGRHDEAHGGFQNHGDSCEGCRHIMLLGMGPGFVQGAVVAERHMQIDIAPTIAGIFGFPFPKRDGKSLFPVENSAVKK